MKYMLLRGLIVPAGLALMMFASGCAFENQVNRNMSPALETGNRTHKLSANDTSRVVDHNTRNAWDDFERLMLLDKPSRLTPYPTP